MRLSRPPDPIVHGRAEGSPCEGAASSAGQTAGPPTVALAQALGRQLPVVSVLGAVALIATLLAAFGRGFDWTDEGYYLNWIASPWDFSASVTQFGFVYHPLYLLANGDIVLLRRVNLLATIVLAAILAALVAQPGGVDDGRRRPRWAIAWLPIAVASLVLVFYRLPPTPSYNSLNLQSLLVIATALVLLQRNGWKPTNAWVLLAVGLAACFLAKPSTAVALAVVVPGYFLLARGYRPLPARGIVVCAATLIGCLVLAAMAIDGSPAAFAQRLAVGREEVRVLDAKQSLSPADFLSRFDLTRSWKRLLLLFALAAAMAVLGWRSTRNRPFTSRTIGWVSAILIAGLAWSLLSMWGTVAPIERLRWIEGGLLALPAGLCAAAVLAWTFPPRRQRVRDRLCLIGLLLALPFTYAFGSNLNPWLATGNAAFFWLLIGLVVLEGVEFRVIYLLMAQILVVLAVGLYLHFPYRQSESLFAPKITLAVPWNGRSQIGFTPDGAEYARALSHLAQSAGLRPRTPTIDLTGHTPGAQYFLASKPLGAAWIPGQYQGSEAYARTVLARVPCVELARAWLLAEPDGPRLLPTVLLAAHGIFVEADLEEVGALAAPIGQFPIAYRQVLYRPSRSAAEAEAACREARRHQRH